MAMNSRHDQWIKRAGLLTVFWLLAFTSYVEARVVINEFMSASARWIRDEDDDHGDWVELLNLDEEETDLGGWGLSDSSSNSFKWVFPEGMIIGPGARLLVFASGKDRRLVDSYRTDWAETYIAEAAALWRLRDDPGNGVIRDTSAGFNNGVPNGGVRRDLRGPNAGALDFHYSGGSVDLGREIVLAGDFTISCWFMTRRDAAWSLFNHSSLSNPAIAHQSPTRVLDTTLAIPVRMEAWEHLVVSQRSGQITLYLNGVVAGSRSSSGPLRFDRLGGSGSATWQPFDGRLGEIMILQRSMDLQEVATLHSMQRTDFLHTSWSIGMEGELLRLTMPDGTVADQVGPIRLRREISYSRTPDGGDFRFQSTPTPGRPNEATGANTILEPPRFSHEPGFHKSAFALTLDHPDPDVRIYYTVDGSEPDPAGARENVWHYMNEYPVQPGPSSGKRIAAVKRTLTYTDPILLSDPSGEDAFHSRINTEFSFQSRPLVANPYKGRVVRAIACKDGMIPSVSETRTFLFHDGTVPKYDLPVVSLVTDADHLFGYENGIYIAGMQADRWRSLNPQQRPPPWRDVFQFHLRGFNHERPVHMEYFDTAGSRSYSADLGLRIHGGWSRNFPRKGLRLYARSLYGTSSMDHDFFDGLRAHDGSGRIIDSFETIVLRNSGSDHSNYLYRDLLMHRLVAHLPLETMTGKPVHHFINGEYWGINNLRERQDEHYLAAHYAIDPEEIAIISNDTLDSGEPGDLDDYLALVDFIDSNDLSDPVCMDWVAARLDLENTALYSAFQILIANHDWPYANIDAWRRKISSNGAIADPGRDGRWRWLVYDLDFGLNGNGDARSLARLLDGSWTFSKVMRGLLKNPEFRDRFLNVLADLMNTALASKRVVSSISEMHALFAAGRTHHALRWNDGSRSPDPTPLVDFAMTRPAHMRSQAVERFSLPGTADMCVGIKGRGIIQVNGMEYSASTPGLDPWARRWNGVWFQGVPVRIRAVPAEGYRFMGWIETPETTNSEITINPLPGNSRTASFEKTGEPAVIHKWDFSSVDFARPFSGDGGSMSAALAPTSTWLRENPAQGFGTSHLRINNPIGTMLILRLPTNGHSSPVLEFLTRRSGQGAGQQRISYTIDGTAWVEFATYDVFDADPRFHSFDFSGIPGTSANSDFMVRIEFLKGLGGISGNNRFDDLTLRGIRPSEANQPPIVRSIPVLQHAVASGRPLEIDLSGIFFNPEGDSDLVVYTAEPEPIDALRNRVEGRRLELSSFLKQGNAVIRMSAEDDDNPSVGTTIPLLIHPPAHRLASGDYHFKEWSPTEPGRRYPSSMLFMMGNDDGSLVQENPPSKAYESPHAASVGESVNLPYNAGSGSRINGLGTGGISFTNVMGASLLGSVVLSLDTRDVEGASVSWEGATLFPGSAPHSFHLRARVGASGPFIDLTHRDKPVIQRSGKTAGTREAIGPIPLPQWLLGHEHVQLQWCYQPDGDGYAGTGSTLALDEIRVQSTQRLSAFSEWRKWHYPTEAEQAEERISGPESDASGLPNLMRYALGLGAEDDPRHALPTLVSKKDGFHLRFACDPDKSDIRYQIQESDDLRRWYRMVFDSRAHPYESSIHRGYLEYPLTVSPDGGNRYFRLAVDFTGDPPRTYDAWRRIHFPNHEEYTSETLSGNSAISRGIPNLIRYAFDVGVHERPPVIAPRITTTPHGVTIRFRHDPEKRDLRYRLLRSTDLIDWNEVLFDSADGAPDGLQTGDYMEWIQPSNEDFQRSFYRVGVEYLGTEPRTFDAWRIRHFTLDERARSGVSGPSAVHDGHANLIRYALGAERFGDMTSLLPGIESTDDQVLFRVPMKPERTDVRYRVQRSSDLMNWDEVLLDSAREDPMRYWSDGWLHVPIPHSSSQRSFVRLSVMEL